MSLIDGRGIVGGSLITIATDGVTALNTLVDSIVAVGGFNATAMTTLYRLSLGSYATLAAIPQVWATNQTRQLFLPAGSPAGSLARGSTGVGTISISLAFYQGVLAPSTSVYGAGVTPGFSQ